MDKTLDCAPRTSYFSFVQKCTVVPVRLIRAYRNPSESIRALSSIIACSLAPNRQTPVFPARISDPSLFISPSISPVDPNFRTTVCRTGMASTKSSIYRSAALARNQPDSDLLPDSGGGVQDAGDHQSAQWSASFSVRIQIQILSRIADWARAAATTPRSSLCFTIIRSIFEFFNNGESRLRVVSA